jgi:hypothetical protein
MTSTPLTRSTEMIIGFLGLSAVLVGVSLYLWNTESKGWSVLVGLLALLIAGGGMAGSWKANCPLCQTPLNDLSQGVCGPCVGCKHYLNVEKKSVSQLKVDYCAGIPYFAVPWDALSDAAPQLCCSCGKDATRTELLVSRAFRGLQLSAHLPHCQACKGGASIQQGTMVTGDAATANPTTFISLAVKSHRFYHDVMMINDAAYAKRST